MAMYANGNESPTLRTYVSDETKVSFLNVSTFKSAQVPWTYFLFILKFNENVYGSNIPDKIQYLLFVKSM